MKTLDRQPPCHPSWCTCRTCTPPLIGQNAETRARRAMALGSILMGVGILILLQL